MTLIVYVDDCLIFCREKSDTNQLIKEGELSSEEETVSSYLGVKVVQHVQTGDITLC